METELYKLDEDFFFKGFGEELRSSYISSHEAHKPVKFQELSKTFQNLLGNKKASPALNLWGNSLNGSKMSECPMLRKSKPITILDWRDETGISDSLHSKSDRKMTGCTDKVCTGSKMNTVQYQKLLPLDGAINQATNFIGEYYKDLQNHEKPKMGYDERLAAVLRDLKKKRYYEMTEDELTWGARTAWRNAPRCPARVIWKKLQVFDKRHIDDAEGMFKAILQHIEFSNNGGNIRPAITVFRQRQLGKKDPRVWNNLVIQFAGYEQEDGSIVGDPAAVEITKAAEKLGWKGAGGMWDVLPIIVSGADGEPKWFDVPEELVMRIPIKHPTIESISDLSLQWFGLPGVSGMMFECGGLQFPGAPFAGWYQGTEIASRDFLDPQRYDLLEPLGEAMGLDMTSNTTMWKDTVSLELNKAVLHSYKEAGVSIVDHYSMADSFVEFMAEEVKDRGGIPADWVWIVPPQSGSLVSTFHQEMVNYHLTPSYEYQDKMYETFLNPLRVTKLTLEAVFRSVWLFSSLMRKQIQKRKKCTIFYSTETGTAKRFSKEASEQFSLSFRAEMKMLDVNYGRYRYCHFYCVHIWQWRCSRYV